MTFPYVHSKQRCANCRWYRNKCTIMKRLQTSVLLSIRSMSKPWLSHEIQRSIITPASGISCPLPHVRNGRFQVFGSGTWLDKQTWQPNTRNGKIRNIAAPGRQLLGGRVTIPSADYGKFRCFPGYRRGLG